MLLCTIDNDIFERIKAEQSINVSYNGFIDYLLQILEGCRKEELHVAIISNGGEQKFIQLFEKRPFKNLTHLYLPVKSADTNTILFHMNQTLTGFQSQLLTCKAQLETQLMEMGEKNSLIENLRQDNRQLRQALKEQDNQILNRNTEELNRLNHEIKELLNAKETNERKMKSELRSQQDKIDSLMRDLFSSNERLDEEIKKNELLKSEIGRMKSYVAENHNLESELEQVRAKERRFEAKFTELQVMHNDAQLQLHRNEKRIEELLAQVEAEKRVTDAKRKTLELAGNEITSANRIIKQQAREIDKLKSKIDLRTELALKQEKVIQEKEAENYDLQSILLQLKKEFEITRLRKSEVLDTIENLQESADSLEEKYKKKIRELGNEIEHSSVRQAKERLKY